jgi:DNA helicase-2/ATP-dependent DNA helicase PcrA
MEWSCVTILNVVDGSFPNEFATRDPALIDEERRLLYVAMTRAKDELALVAPLRFNVTSAGPKSDAHVYGGRSRFLTNKVISTLEPATFHGANALAAGLGDSPKDVVDVTQRVRAMW